MLEEEHAELVDCGEFSEVLGVGARGFEDEEGLFLEAVRMEGLASDNTAKSS